MDSEVVQKHRFHDFGPAEEAAVVDGAIPKNTKKANCFWINVFDTFCREKKIRFDFEKCSAEELGQVLKRFYGGLRKKNGDVYQPGGYLAARAAIQRRVLHRLGAHRLLGRALRGLSVIEQTLRLSRAMFVCLYRRTDRSLGAVAGRGEF